MKKFLSFTIVALLALSTVAVLPAPRILALSGSHFTAGRIIDDPIFFDPNRMQAPDIQAFLNSKVPVCDTNGTQMHGSQTRAEYSAANGVSTPFICLKDYKQNTPAKAADAYCSALGAGTQKTAAQIIDMAADACRVSPMVLLTLLQKEQALITDDWPWPVQYQKATGYGCPDTASCASEYSGFFNQIYHAARQFRRYALQPELFNYRVNRSGFVQYNPNGGCGGGNISMFSEATAALYNYTPYQPNQAALNNLYGTGDGCSSYGNRNFWRLYNDWFGSTITSACAFATGEPVITDVMMRKVYSNIDSGNLVIYSGSGTNCIESHSWGNNFSSWMKHTASNQRALIPNNCAVRFADLSGDGKDEPILYCFQNTGSGMVEFHVWNYDMRGWVVRAVSNLPEVDPSQIAIDFADLNGDGKDEPVVMGYSGTTSGFVEFHTWNDGLKTWKDHFTSNLPVINPAEMNIAFADLNGDKKDEGIAIGVDNTTSNKIEFHVWDQGFQTWKTHITSNQDVVNMGDFSIVFGNFTGKGPDRGVLVGKRNTASGKIEFHVWNGGLDSWSSHNASNQGSF